MTFSALYHAVHIRKKDSHQQKRKAPATLSVQQVLLAYAHTLDGYKSLIDAQIAPYFADKKIKLKDIGQADLQDYINDKRKTGNHVRKREGLASKTLSLHWNVMKQALEHAKTLKLIAEVPPDPTLPKRVPRDPQIFNIDEIVAFLNAIKDERLALLFYMTLLYGMRRSEVLGLQWCNIDFNAGTINIRHTVVQSSSCVTRKDRTKSESSWRTYPIPADVKAGLLATKKREGEERALCGKDYIENDYVFKWPNGKPYEPDYISKKFKKILKKANLKKIRFHDLRHSSANLLLSLGFTLMDIKDWLGHSDISVTVKYYLHPDMERKSEIGEKVAGIINPGSVEFLVENA